MSSSNRLTMCMSYLASVADLRDQVSIKDLVDALTRKDIDAAIEALNIEDSAFGPLRTALTHAFEAGGNLAVNLMPRLVKKNG